MSAQTLNLKSLNIEILKVLEPGRHQHKFKSLNTAFGETVVDDTILPEFQRVLERLCRHRGGAYRQGGEKFLVVLANHTAAEGAVFAERIRAGIEATVFNVSPQSVRLAISVGVASSPANGSTYLEVLRAANVAEHRAKSNGGNQVVVADLTTA